MNQASNAAAKPGRPCAPLCGLLSLCLVAWALPAAADGGHVSIDNFTFTPPELTVAVGTSVTWTNQDDIPHTVTADGKAFRSKPLDTGDAFSFTFMAAGEYAYFCSLHPHMTGRIIVKAR